MLERSGVTVIVPAYKAVVTIGQALRSIAAQTVKPDAVIVVDDGSPDDTAEAVEALRSEMIGIDLTLIRQENKGAGAARNRALFAATTPLVAFLDSDDRWSPTKLERSLLHLRSGEYVLVSHDFMQAAPDAEEVLVPCAALYNAACKTNAYHGLYRKGFIGTSTVVAKREALTAAGGFDETLFAAQDFDLWLKALADPGVSFNVFDEPLTHYMKNADGITSNVARRLECTLRVAARHFLTLRRHTGQSALNSRLYRVLAVHYEALSAYRARGEIVYALGVIMVCPFRLLKAMVSSFK